MSNYKMLSGPLARIRPEYSAVVVGSGYGAGVAASRLARAGQSVCVLERGREIAPGEFPTGIETASKEFQIDTSRGRLGDPYGLFNVHYGNDMLALVGCGLGGTSLINANVALEVDERLFDREPNAWPAEFRQDTKLLAPYLERAKTMLDFSPYPDSFPKLNKLEALKTSAEAMQGNRFYRPPICVNFRQFEHGVNAFGVRQPPCTLCGDCTSGCNDGAKNTTQMNYLPDAVNHGAEIYTRAKVTHVTREGERWRVHFTGPDGGETRPYSVAADVVVLGAGALGSTEILLRSREKGLPLSAQLGKNFSGNGDVLAFGYNNHWQTDSDSTPDKPTYKSLYGIGRGSNNLTPGQLPGPCITGVIDFRGAPRVEDGLVIEEGVIPGSLAAVLSPAAFMADALFGNALQYGPDQAASFLLEAQVEGEAVQSGAFSGRSYLGPVSRSQTYLVMSVDDAAGALELATDAAAPEGRLEIRWPGAGRARVIERDNDLLREANDAIQGHFIPNPLWTEAQGYKLITVHPLGGCGMGDDATKGVVDHKCRVYASAAGAAVHAGLYVCDGAVMPGAVGVNPLLTITAVAERACALLAQDRGWTIDYEIAPVAPPPSGPAPVTPAPPAAEHHESRLERLGEKLRSWLHKVEQEILDEIHRAVGQAVRHLEAHELELAKGVLRDMIEKHPHVLSPSFQFTETMRGFVSLRPLASGDTARERISTDFELAAGWGRANGHALEFELCVQTDDLSKLNTDPTHPATITGTVSCAALSSAPMAVTSGEFHLFTVDHEHVETWRMTYEMVLKGPDGPIHFSGFKVLHQRSGSHWWNDVTTLYVTLRRGADGAGGFLAQGVLTLNMEDLMWQAASIKVEAAHGVLADIVNHFPEARAAIEMAYMAKFAGFFGGVLFQAYGGMLADLKDFPAQEGARPPRRALQAPAAQSHPIPLEDGAAVSLTRYRGGAKGPVILAPGFTVRASSFAIDTVQQNLVEYLCNHGYDVWLFDYRASPDSGNQNAHYTIDDIARTDWPAATRYVLETTGAETLQVVAHCVGSMSLLMALLSGMEGVRCAVCSSLTVHPVTNWLSYLKVDLDLVNLLDSMDKLKDGFNIAPAGPKNEFDYAIDALTWNVPVPRGEECKNPVCHRVFSIFGPSYTHAQLNHATHTAMREMFGHIAIPPFNHLSSMVDRGQVVDREGNDTYLANAARLRRLPISLITGALNRIFDPETIVRTHHWLCEQNGNLKSPSGYEMYEQHVFADYAHMDLYVGLNAARDVYPHILERLERYPATA